MIAASPVSSAATVHPLKITASMAGRRAIAEAKKTAVKARKSETAI